MNIEIRNSKQIHMIGNKTPNQNMLFGFGVLKLSYFEMVLGLQFVSDFVLRISDLFYFRNSISVSNFAFAR